MGIDQSFIQLILNVVMTTSATALSLSCYLLKQENQKLNTELRVRNERGQSLSIPQSQQEIDSEPNCAPVLNAGSRASAVACPDIREFVKRRSQDWLANGIVNVPEAVQNRDCR